MLSYCQLDPSEQTSVKFNQNTKLFIHKNISENIVCETAAILSGGDELRVKLQRAITPPWQYLMQLPYGQSLLSCWCWWVVWGCRVVWGRDCWWPGVTDNRAHFPAHLHLPLNPRVTVILRFDDLKLSWGTVGESLMCTVSAILKGFCCVIVMHEKLKFCQWKT